MALVSSGKDDDLSRGSLPGMNSRGWQQRKSAGLGNFWADLTHRRILKEVWGPGAANETHYLRVFMAQHRRKVESDPARPRLLLTELDVGYRMRESGGGGRTGIIWQP